MCGLDNIHTEDKTDPGLFSVLVFAFSIAVIVFFDCRYILKGVGKVKMLINFLIFCGIERCPFAKPPMKMLSYKKIIIP